MVACGGPETAAARTGDIRERGHEKCSATPQMEPAGLKIVTGMHRSGTSLAARLLYGAGADLGNPKTFYRPDRWNPEGYYEQPEVHAINMPLVNGALGRLSYFRLPSRRTILRRALPLAARIGETAAKYRAKFVKDPRFCLTLPAWTEHGAEIGGILVCLRDPSSVVASLRRRNRTFERHAFYLWRVHNSRLLDSIRGLPAWIVYYRNLLDEERFDRELDAALRFFGIEKSAEERKDLWDRCVRKSMDHSPSSSPSYPPRVEGLWQDLLRRHQRQFEGGAR